MSDRRLLRRHAGRGRIDSDLGGVQIALSDQALFRQLARAGVLLLRVGQPDPRAIQLAVGPGEVGPGLAQVGLHLPQLRVEQRWIEPRHDLTLLDDGIEIRAEPLDVAGDLAAHLHGGDGLQGARRADAIDDVSARHRHGRNRNFSGLSPQIPRPGRDRDHRHGHEDDDRSLHIVVTLAAACPFTAATKTRA